MTQPSFLSQSNHNDNLKFKPLKEATSLTRKILSSIEVPLPLQFTPYTSMLPQKNNVLTDSASLKSFKRDAIIYFDHKVTSCDEEITSGEKNEEKESRVFAIIIETNNNNDISKFKEEILLNCGDNYFVNEDSIVYERGTDRVLGYEEKEKEKDSENENEIFKLNHNIDKSLIISIRKCFNCSSPYHSYNNCQLPLDKELIRINKEKFSNEQDNKSSNNNERQQFNSRYYIEYEKDSIFNIFLPGVISDVLKDALGILENGVEPPYYERMKIYGYPPGYWGYNEGDDPLKPKRDRLSKLDEEQWNSATLKIYDNNECESDDLSSISNDSTTKNSENDNSKNSKNKKDRSEIDTNNTKKIIIDPYTESQKETFKKEIQETQEPRQEKKKKVPLVYYPGLNLDFAKFENKNNKAINKTDLNHKINYGNDFYSTNTGEYYQYYRTMSDWYFNRYSENVNIENEWPPGTINLETQTPPWTITSGLEVQPPPPGTITSNFGVQVPPTPSYGIQPLLPWVTPSFETDTYFKNFEAVFNHPQKHPIVEKSSLLLQKNNSKSDSLPERMKSVNHQNNEMLNVEDCMEEDNDMDLSD